MADEHGQDPNEFINQAELRGLYRDGPDPEGPSIAHTPQKRDIRDYYLPDDEPYADEEHLLTEPHHAPDLVDHEEQWHPEKAAEALALAQAEPVIDAVPQPATAAITDLQAQSAEILEPTDEAIGPPDEPGKPLLQPQPAKWDKSPIVRFAAIGGFLGIVFGACLIGFTWLFGKPDGPYDLGNSFSTAVGLKGHLYTKWDDDKVQYRLSFEPTEPKTAPAFALAVSNPPRPLSISIQLKDAMGFVLCSRDIALKYDPTASASAPGPADTGKSGSTPATPVDMAQLFAAENQREQGKDLFQPLNGPDGQIASINAQGQIPCTDKAYSKVVGWGFTPDFPSLTEQTETIKQQVAKQVEEVRQAAARKRGPQKPVDKTITFSIEGDDSIMGYDPTVGLLETGTGDSFYIEKDASATIMSAWQAFPIRVHYRCDSTSFCTLTQVSSGAVLHARRRR